MKKRFDRIVAVRKAASRAASGVFADAASRVAQHENLSKRLEGAAAMLSPDPGAASGSTLGAQLELAGRMNGAIGVAQGRIDCAVAERTDAAIVRKAARRALDTAVDMCRDRERAVALRRETQTVPLVAKDRI